MVPPGSFEPDDDPGPGCRGIVLSLIAIAFTKDHNVRIAGIWGQDDHGLRQDVQDLKAAVEELLAMVRDPSAFGPVLRGLRQAAEGGLHDLGSFAGHADEAGDEDDPSRETLGGSAVVRLVPISANVAVVESAPTGTDEDPDRKTDEELDPRDGPGKSGEKLEPKVEGSTLTASRCIAVPITSEPSQSPSPEPEVQAPKGSKDDQRAERAERVDRFSRAVDASGLSKKKIENSLGKHNCWTVKRYQGQMTPTEEDIKLVEQLADQAVEAREEARKAAPGPEAAPQAAPAPLHPTEEFKRLRAQTGMSQKEFGTAMGYDPAQAQGLVSRLETGRAEVSEQALLKARGVARKPRPAAQVGRTASEVAEVPRPHTTTFTDGEPKEPPVCPGVFLVEIDHVAQIVEGAACGYAIDAKGLHDENVAWILHVLSEDVLHLRGEHSEAARHLRLSDLRRRLAATATPTGYVRFGRDH